MKYWLTSDLHLGHANIIRYCNRPFKDINHMNEELVRRFNERVQDEDQVYHIGDFCFKNSNPSRGEGERTSASEWIKKLNGQKIFIKGNHDRNNSLRTMMDNCVITFGGEKYFMTHSPEHANPKFKINFVGHVHERWHYKTYKGSVLINVGVDVNGFYPKTIEETLREHKHWLRNNVLEEYVPWGGYDREGL
jgi:calcineurin-like phosphoesterase family protein